MIAHCTRAADAIAVAQSYLSACRSDSLTSSLHLSLSTDSVSASPSSLAQEYNTLHRSARIVVPATVTINDAVVSSLLRHFESFETRASSGLTVSSHSWTLSHHDVPIDITADAPVTAPSPPMDSQLSLCTHTWHIDAGVAMPDGGEWRCCHTESLLSHSDRVSSQELLIVVVYGTSLWPASSAWAIPQSLPISGWLRHWERCCTRFGLELLSVSQVAPAVH